MRFKIDWASLIVGRKFTVFSLFYFVLEGNFQLQAPQRLIFGIFRNFMVLWFKSLFLIVLSTVILFYLVVGALGVMFEYGIGVRPDRQAAFKCLKEAAARGNVYAQGNLAVLYFRRKLLNKAADVAKRY